MTKNWLIHNMGLKLIALALAIITWYYVNHQLFNHVEETHRISQTKNPS